jgi:hypothetical protein
MTWQFDFRTEDWGKTWVYDPQDAGTLIPEAILPEIITAVTWPNNVYWREESWEERLARAIERRSIRRRLRIAWFSSRYAMALDVLRGKHECGYDW